MSASSWSSLVFTNGGGRKSGRKNAARGELAAGEEPRRRPSFTETMQIGIVVRDLDAAVRRYVDDDGSARGRSTNSSPATSNEWREHGQPAEPSTRFATTMVGRV